MSEPGSVERVAAIDLGSNSFHMVVARIVNGEPVLIDRHREPVRLAAGLDEESRLSADARERALDTLRRFGQTLRDVPAHRVRAVGTNTLRAARNASDFLDEAEEALGFPVEIVSGREEARLVYLGVSHSVAASSGPRLVVDIGGGSTECILGERFEALEAHSLYMGCVDHSRRFFGDGKLDGDAMSEAVLAARVELQTVERRFREPGWSTVVGSSGTIRAVETVLAANGWCDHGITVAGLRKLKKAVVAAGKVERLASLAGLKSERVPVFAGGLAILLAIFKSLRVKEMEVTAGALREGVLYDLLGRIRHEDVRERTIRGFQERYHVDLAQASRVERTALSLLSQVTEAWGLDQPEVERFLTWAAQLHEIGLAVSYTHHHRHGGYLIANSDMPGFSRNDQLLLAAIVAGHRRKVPSDCFAALRPERVKLAQRLTVLLRLAVLINRNRGPGAARPVTLVASKDRLDLSFPAAWLDDHPLTREDLRGETKRLRALEVKLSVAAPEDA